MIGAYCAESITITPKGTRTNAGAWSYNGTPVATTARVSRKTGLRRDKDGREYTYSYIVWCRYTESVTLEDKITIGGVVYYVMEIDAPRFIDGTQAHKRLYVA